VSFHPPELFTAMPVTGKERNNSTAQRCDVCNWEFTKFNK